MVDRTQPIRDQKITAPTPIGVKGGCSPQNYLGKVSKTDASQVCLGNTGLCRLCYVEFTYSCVSQADTLSVVPNAGNVIETQEHNDDFERVVSEARQLYCMFRAVFGTGLLQTQGKKG